MNKTFKITKPDPEMRELIEKTDKKILAIWAIECAERVMHLFKEWNSRDTRPEAALETLRQWIRTGIFNMSAIRKASLDSHAAAREVGEDKLSLAFQASAARSAARACGQAVATAHVKAHAYGAAIYAQQAIFRKSNSIEKVEIERDFQFKKLLILTQKNGY